MCNDEKKHIELLAPAGSFESLDAAYAHGADAVYIGIGPFNLRALAPNFYASDMAEILATARSYNKKLYVVLNSMPSNAHLDKITLILETMLANNTIPDAFIVSDPGVIRMIQKHLGMQTELHLSTQTGTFNKESFYFWKEHGIKRIVLPREMSLHEIEILSQDKNCETEIFIHGAICVSISGRCLLGAYMAGRHPNHGSCPQPCRFRYSIKEISNTDTGKHIDIEEDENGVYMMNAKDLSTISIIPQIISAKVSSLKIEGRNKSVHYVSSVVKTYRAALDSYLSDPKSYKVKQCWIDELESLDHRPYTTGFYTGEYNLQSLDVSKKASKMRVVGVVKDLLNGGRSVVDVKNPFTKGETLSLLPVNHKEDISNILITSISDISGNCLKRAVTNRIVAIKTARKLRIGDILRNEL